MVLGRDRQCFAQVPACGLDQGRKLTCAIDVDIHLLEACHISLKLDFGGATLSNNHLCRDGRGTVRGCHCMLHAELHNEPRAASVTEQGLPLETRGTSVKLADSVPLLVSELVRTTDAGKLPDL